MLIRRNICGFSLLLVFVCSALSRGQNQFEAKAPASSARDSSHSSRHPAQSMPESPLNNPPAQSDQPESMFDALASGLPGTVSVVEVHAESRNQESAEPFRAGGQEILSTAGSFGDVERFLQVLPGVVATSDLSNEVLVRGGHPMENLFTVDGIEIPNINHLAIPGTTGGFGAMIDSAVIQGINFYTGGYDAHYPERLSSVIDIETLEPKNLSTHAEADIGMEGMGGLIEKQFRGNDLLASAHKGFLQLMQSAGIGGLPAYQNELIRLRRTSPSGDRLTILHLAGMDSVAEEPCPTDPVSTTSIDSRYSGWRETTGLQWQHVYSSRSFGIATVSDSEEIENISQQDQLPDPANPPAYVGGCPGSASPTPPVTVYAQHSNEAFSTAGYQFEWSGSHAAFSAGSAFWLQRPHYQVIQPVGTLSPYSAIPVRTDNTSFASRFSTGESGTFAQFTARTLHEISLVAGGRLQTFALGDHVSLTPRLSVRFDPNEHVSFHVAYTGYAQMPPFVYLLAYPQNRAMLPMRATHQIVGLDLRFGLASQIHVEAYNKIYRDIPAATEYPSVNLHSVADMLGDQIVWLPMNSGGRGQASGIEISDVMRIGPRLVARASVAYSRAMFAGLDGIRRPSNYDLPWITNFVVLQRFARGYELSSRFGFATGRPYTPFDLPDSFAQNRPIYDVLRTNSQRAPYFARLDAQLNKDFLVRGLHLELYAGMNNVLNRKNFLSYVWLPFAQSADSYTNPVYQISQMPIFPNFGLRYLFR